MAIIVVFVIVDAVDVLFLPKNELRKKHKQQSYDFIFILLFLLFSLKETTM